MRIPLPLLLLAGFGLPSQCSAQSTATATVAASIVSPIHLSKTSDMDFGMIASSGTAGAVSLVPTGMRSASNSSMLPSTTGTVSAASFLVSGESNYTYSITLPTTAVLTRLSGVETMTVAQFSSIPATTGKLTAAGSQVLNVGATLLVGAAQTPGAYVTDTPFEVVVNYN